MGEGRPPTVHGHQLPPQLLEGGGASASLTLALCGTGHTFFKGDSSHLFRERPSMTSSLLETFSPPHPPFLLRHHLAH